MSDTQNNSTLGAIFGWGGAILGFLGGMSSGELGPAVVGAIFFAIVGTIIGRFVEWVVARVLFVGMLIVLFAVSPLGRFTFMLVNHTIENRGS